MNLASSALRASGCVFFFPYLPVVVSLQSRNETIKTLQKAAAHWPGLDDHRQATCCSHQAASNVCNTLRVISKQKRLCTRDGVLVLAVSSEQDPMAAVHCEPGKPVGMSSQVCPANSVECRWYQCAFLLKERYLWQVSALITLFLIVHINISPPIYIKKHFTCIFLEPSNQ